MATPSTEEVCDVMNWADGNINAGRSMFPGMTFEEGVAETARWLLEDGPRPDAMPADEAEGAQS